MNLFLFGAGASFGNPDTLPYPPPLGRDLFDTFATFAPITKGLSPEIITRFRANFEDGMAGFAETRSAAVVPFLRDLGRFFAQFRPGPENYYCRLFRLLREQRCIGVHATLNYDLLIEASLALEELEPGYLSTGKADEALVLKLHGSCNFLPNYGVMKRVQWTNWRADEIMSGPIRFGNYDECNSFYASDDSRAPTMSMYMPGKQSLFTHTMILEQQKVWKARIGRATRIIVIGVGIYPEDDHIWGPLARSKSPLIYVGPDEALFAAWCNQVGRRNAIYLADTFEDALHEIRPVLRGVR